MHGCNYGLDDGQDRRRRVAESVSGEGYGLGMALNPEEGRLLARSAYTRDPGGIFSSKASSWGNGSLLVERTM